MISIWFFDPAYSGIWNECRVDNVYIARRVYDALRAAGFKMRHVRP